MSKPDFDFDFTDLDGVVRSAYDEGQRARRRVKLSRQAAVDAEAAARAIRDEGYTVRVVEP